MKHSLFTAALLLAAIALYMTGFSGGGVVALAAALTLEMWFWLRLFRQKAQKRHEVDVPAPR